MRHKTEASAASYQKQALEKMKLSDCKITGHYCLQPLKPRNAHTNMRGLNHRYVIGTVPDRQAYFAQAVLDHLHHQRFLHGRHPASHNSLAASAQLQEVRLEVRA